MCSLANRASGLLLFALFALLYATTATRTIQGGDTAEFTWTAAVGGVPHPPGYPLYVLLGRLLSFLPAGTPAWRAALVSGLAMAGAVAILARALVRATGSLLAGCAAAIGFGASPLAFCLGSQPEVFALNAFFAACLVWLLVWVVEGARDASGPSTETRARGRPRRVLFLAGLVFGLGLANHHTLVLLAPIGVAILLVQVRACSVTANRAEVMARLAGMGLLGLLLGLMPYLVLVLAAHTTCTDLRVWCWGDTGTPAGLLAHVLRREFGTFSLGLATRELRPGDELGDLFLVLGAQGLGAGALLSLYGIGLLLRSNRALGVPLLASLICCGPVLVARFNLPDTALGRAVAERFYLLPLLLLMVFLAWPLARAFGWFDTRARGDARFGVVRSLPALLLVIVLGGLVWRGVRYARYAKDDFIERYLGAALAEVDRNAVILGLGDEDLFGYHYLLSQSSARADVRYLDLHLVRRPWYHARARRELPDFSVPLAQERTPVFAILDQLARVRPVYVTRDVRTLLPADITYPEGLLYRVRFIDDPVPKLDTLRVRAERALAQLDDAFAHGPADAWSQQARGKAVAPALDLVRALTLAGDHVSAARLRARAAALVPGIGHE